MPEPRREPINPAPAGQVWVCGACGKRSHDQGGNDPIDHGWDESCYMWAVLCYEQPNPDGTYRAAEKP